MREDELLEYGIQQFEKEIYEEALEAFVLLHMREYNQEEILKNIYSCYMEGNEGQFRETYGRCSIFKEIPYEECLLDFVPYKEGEYFIYDKLKRGFLGTLSLPEIEREKELNREFDDIAVELDWDWRLFKPALKWTGKHKLYAICHDKRRSVSFCKIPEMEKYFQKVFAFGDREEYRQYFHTNTSVFLPRFFWGNQDDKLALAHIWEEEHAYRLTPQGRNTENVVLSIGIPTHDRGNLALEKVVNLLTMK